MTNIGGLTYTQKYVNAWHHDASSRVGIIDAVVLLWRARAQCFTIRRMSSSDNSRQPAAGPVYEQPLNERMRTFLRLDFLYQQALYHEEREDQWSTRAAMSSLLEILAITARGDVRSEVL